MHGFEKGFVSSAELLRLQTENPVDLVRPGEPVTHKIQLPASQMRDFLGLLELGVAVTQRVLGVFQLAEIKAVRPRDLLLRGRPWSGRDAVVIMLILHAANPCISYGSNSKRRSVKRGDRTTG